MLGWREILAVARLSKEHGVEEAEVSLLIGDAWQGKGIGSELTRQLVKKSRGTKSCGASSPASLAITSR